MDKGSIWSTSGNGGKTETSVVQLLPVKNLMFSVSE